MKKKFKSKLLLVSLLFLSTASQLSAQEVPDWFTQSSQNISVTKLQNNPLGEITIRNAPCVPSTFNHYSEGSWNTVYSGETTECTHQTNYGEIGEGGGALLKGVNTAYKIRPYDGSMQGNFFPVVGTNHLYSVGGGTGAGREYFYIYKNFPTRFTVTKNSQTQKPIYYKLIENNYSEQNKVKYQNGVGADLQPLSVSYAANGKYMLANNGNFQALIDVESVTARKFGGQTPAYSGVYPKVNTALSQNGNLAMVNISDASSVMLYDLSQCTAQPSGVESCRSHYLTSVLQSKIPNFKSITRAQFVSDDIIYFQARVGSTNGIISEWYKASLPQLDGGVNYLALGDSFASGEGAYNYKSGTDEELNQCHTSLDSYGYLIKNQLSYSLAESVACSGAKIKDIRKVDKAEYSSDDPQAKGRDGFESNDDIYEQYLPGYRRQIEFVSKKKPEAITLSIGGNDIGFGDKLSWCILSPQSCYMLPSSRAGLLKEVKALFPELSKTYSALKNASPETRIYIVGYPNIAKPDGQCALNVRLTNEEIKFSEAIISDLNTVIRTAAEKAGVFYVDVEDAFNGHRMCEVDSLSAAVNGLTLGNDAIPVIGYPLGKSSFHPNKLGHQLFKQSILGRTNNLLAPMPTANSSVSLNNMNSKLATNTSTVGIPLPMQIYTGPILEKPVKRAVNQVFNATINGFLEKNANYRVEIHSEPIEIGTAIAEDQNTLSVNLTIPAEVELGPHTIHIIGNNLAGEPIDMYKEIVVIASEEDHDGDGILNTEDACVFISPANIDADEDGIDDVCDPYIGTDTTEPPDDEPLEDPEDELPLIPEGGTSVSPTDGEDTLSSGGQVHDVSSSGATTSTLASIPASTLGTIVAQSLGGLLHNPAQQNPYGNAISPSRTGSLLGVSKSYNDVHEKNTPQTNVSLLRTTVVLVFSVVTIGLLREYLSKRRKSKI